VRRRKRWTVRGFGVVESEGHHFSTKTGPEAALTMWAWDKIPVEGCELQPWNCVASIGNQWRFKHLY